MDTLRGHVEFVSSMTTAWLARVRTPTDAFLKSLTYEDSGFQTLKKNKTFKKFRKFSKTFKLSKNFQFLKIS
jgi:hypothetical protein